MKALLGKRDNIDLLIIGDEEEKIPAVNCPLKEESQEF
jgi:hypothetical protein